MSIEYLNLAWSTSMPPLKKLVFISLADQANGSGACYPSIGYIEKRTGLSRRSVIRSIQWLEEQGFVSVSRQDRSRNYYQINASATQTPSVTVTPPSATATPEGCQTDTRTSATVTPKPPITINNHQITGEWYPSEDTILALEKSGFRRSWITPALIQEFLIYWTERKKDLTPAQLQGKFIANCMRKKPHLQLEPESKIGFVEKHTDQSWRSGL